RQALNHKSIRERPHSAVARNGRVVAGKHDAGAEGRVAGDDHVGLSRAGIGCRDEDVAAVVDAVAAHQERAGSGPLHQVGPAAAGCLAIVNWLMSVAAKVPPIVTSYCVPEKANTVAFPAPKTFDAVTAV